MSIGNAILVLTSAFIELSRYFHQQAIPVPEILKVDDSQQLYLQEYLGEQDLLSIAIENKQAGFLSDAVMELYRKSIAQLVKMQLPASANLDFAKYCYPVEKFDSRAMLWDLNYFKYYFLKMMNEQINDDLLEQDFTTLVNHLANARHQGFMFRDFQARNIMILGNEPYFIDYQGGRFGAVTYDLASLLHQAKAAIPESQKQELVDFYFQQLSKYVSADYKLFLNEYHSFTLIRLLQTLGAYGFRGLIQKKTHFVESLQPAIKNIKYFCQSTPFSIELPYLFSQIEKL